jgi:hypothetical protein
MPCLQKYGILLALLVLICLTLPACAWSEDQPPPATVPSRSAPSPRSAQPAESSSEIARTESDEDADRDEEKVDEDSDDGGDSDDESRFFHGYRCTVDCSGHEAGYKWAEDHDIDDVDNCGGNSQSFIEGCQAWVEENQ